MAAAASELRVMLILTGSPEATAAWSDRALVLGETNLETEQDEYCLNVHAGHCVCYGFPFRF